MRVSMKIMFCKCCDLAVQILKKLFLFYPWIYKM